MVTPVRRQYLDLKARHPDAILLFRLGDFYETFDEDAKLVARELDIALTSKPMGGGLRCPLAGVPVRSVEQHLARLVGRGHRVAICEQLEHPRAARGLVRRGVVRVVSPGTALEPALLESGQASACAAVLLQRDRRRLRLGVAAADVTTGAFHVAELSGQVEAEPGLWEAAADLLERLGAREVLLRDDDDDQPLGAPFEAVSEVAATRRPAHEFRRDRAARSIESQFAAPPAAFGFEARPAALGAAGALITYLRAALPDEEREAGANERPEGGALRHLAPPLWLDSDSRLSWDAATQRALAVHDAGPADEAGSGPRTLLEVVDRCGSAPGRRWLRASLAAPLLDIQQIEERLDRVDGLHRRPALRRALAARLRGSGDPERLFARAAAGLALPAELVALARGLIEAGELGGMLREGLVTEESGALAGLAERLGPAPEAAAQLLASLAEQPPSEFGRGVLRAGADAESDRWRAAAERARARLAALEAELRRESGIEQLRVAFHRTFGYQIELPRSQSSRAPESWERRQSLRDRERFTEPRLGAIERELEDAEERLAEAERSCTERLREELVAEAETVRRIASALARLDAACALAGVAAERAWTRPVVEHSGELEIEGGRHPLVEAAAAQGGFVPNDLRLADDGLRAPQLLLVTGPNMAGKSTYLRQAALIVILAQTGSFVPAERARIGLVDRIFARVGAHDDLTRGRSTFMVEMLESARLLHGATDRSLVLLDEIGRGTSTWDGLAIAQAVAEDLAGGGPEGRPAGRLERGPRTLFATHFHELTALSGALARVANASVQVQETAEGSIEFLYRVEPGAADRSYGVQVAAQAGLPASVLSRARALLEQLESDGAAARAPLRAPSSTPQLMLMPPPAHPILHDLADLDIDGITPLEAISALYALRDQARVELRGSDAERSAGAGS
ncbi:MAG: DNA mismatch repair protein MutS [Chloroflexi bacterium]|nr:DNA mismatch repair protein MutS [Chloroflexota bacterium]